MSRGLSLAPCGLVIERVESETDKLLLVARPISKTAACPSCGGISARIHSQYQRALADLPSQGRLVRISLWARRFRCAVAECQQTIFTERLEATASRPFARRTTRLEGIVHHVGLALGGRPGQSIARRLLLPVSKDTLLRVVRRNAVRADAAPRAVGIDDWATLAKVPTAQPLESQGRAGSAAIATARSSVIWKSIVSSTSCLIARQQQSPLGSPSIPRSASSPEIVARATLLGSVQHAGAALVELPATVAAAKAPVALGSAIPPLRDSRGATVNALHSGSPSCL